MDLLTLGVFAAALLLAAGTPGPSIAALVSQVMSHGWRAVLPFVAAMWLGEVLWLTLALMGLTQLAQSFHTGFVALKWAGIAYLIWMAWKMWHQPVSGQGAELPKRGSSLSLFATGMALTLGNPKIMVFYLALLPSLIDMNAVGFSEWAILALVTLLTLAVIDLAWIFAAERARGFLRSPRAVRVANRISATTLGGAALAIALKD